MRADDHADEKLSADPRVQAFAEVRSDHDFGRLTFTRSCARHRPSRVATGLSTWRIVVTKSLEPTTFDGWPSSSHASPCSSVMMSPARSSCRIDVVARFEFGRSDPLWAGPSSWRHSRLA